MGDLNNTGAARERIVPTVDPSYKFRSFAISPRDDDPVVREKYRPFLISDAVHESDWIAKLELATVAEMVEREILSQGKDRLRVLVLYGSLRSRFVAPFLPHGEFLSGILLLV
jgi:arsenic resistance protein ArsH